MTVHVLSQTAILIMTETFLPKARLGMVNFINTAPVYIPWQEQGAHPAWEIVEGTPTELNAMLKAGELDAGLVSSYAYGLDYQDYFLLPDLGISATGAVGSVLLFSRVPVQDLHGKVVGLSPQSATSVNLLRIILERFAGVRPRYRTGCFMELEQGDADAYLSIGDEALRRRSESSRFMQYDLAEIWLEHTGLPFVFAVCAVRAQSLEQRRGDIAELGKALTECRSRGSRDMERISAMVAGRIPMDPGACLEYLEGIEFDLSEDKQRGLLYFFRILAEMGDFPHIESLRLAMQ